MNKSTQPVKPKDQKADTEEVLDLLRDFAALLLEWSWEGTIGFEDELEKVGATYGFGDTTAIVSSQSAIIQMEGRQGNRLYRGIAGVPGANHSRRFSD